MRGKGHQSCGVTVGLLVVMLASIVPLAGCEGPTKLPVTPNVLRDGSGSQALAQLPPEERSVDIPVVYVTDRAAVSGPAKYGVGRSHSLAYGMATVGLDPMPGWDELVRASGSGEGRRYALKVSKIEEQGKFLLSPASLEVHDGDIRLRPEAAETLARVNRQVMDLVRSRLAVTRQKDVYVYVHGVENTFEDAIDRAAVIWHFSGRQGVMLAYAWPAGRGGTLGYFYDRESGEYTVFHLKKLLMQLATCPEVERIHVIAHSRGCDVATTALRELNIECRARGQETQKELKLETLMLCAADMDVEVFSLRLTLEDMAVVARRFVVYSSSKDELLSAADWLFHSRARLGTLSKPDVPQPAQDLLAQVPNVQLVQCVVSGFGTTHDYPFTNPGAFSDLILVLRDRRDPGAANGRPLTPLGGVFWRLDNNYGLPAKKPPGAGGAHGTEPETRKGTP
jgi:esterase/lipase superfamily enzyme